MIDLLIYFTACAASGWALGWYQRGMSERSKRRGREMEAYDRGRHDGLEFAARLQAAKADRMGRVRPLK